MSRHGSQTALAEALRQMGSLTWQSGELEEARPPLEEAQEMFGKLGLLSGQGSCLSELAEVDRFQKKFDAALNRNQEALDCFRANGAAVSEAAVIHQRAGIALDCGQPEAAREMSLNALAFQRQNRRRADEAACLRTLGLCELALKRIGSARSVLLDALALEVQVGKLVGQGVTLIQLGETESLAGEKAAAKDYFVRAAELFDAMEDRGRVALCHDWISRLS
jgi:tetratricopeptide (TPR) repeat protein